MVEKGASKTLILPAVQSLSSIGLQRILSSLGFDSTIQESGGNVKSAPPEHGGPIKNRICKAPQTTGLSHMDGSVSQRLVRYYEDLARGEVGMIIVEYAYIDRLYSKSASNQLGICDNEFIVGLGWLADSIKNAGSVPCIQIEHCGRQRFLGPPMKSASANPWPLMYERYGKIAIPEALTIDEIHDIIEAFGKAAWRAKTAGFEVVEIHAAHGYLITNFLSPFTNQRNDWYGGSRENRFRIL